MTILDEPLLPDEEAARILKVKKQTPASWRNRGQGSAYVKVGRRVFYRPSDLREWLESRVVRPRERGAA
jgi:Helix-turn-helix domain